MTKQGKKDAQRIEKAIQKAFEVKPPPKRSR